jgi:hypothetical protein
VIQFAGTLQSYRPEMVIKGKYNLEHFYHITEADMKFTAL